MLKVKSDYRFLKVYNLPLFIKYKSELITEG